MSEALFEGNEVVDYQAKLPAVTVDCDYYRSGTILRLAVEVRVKGVGYEEDKNGNYVRQHKLGIQDIEVVSAFDPSQQHDGISGSLAGGAVDVDSDTGLNPGRTGDTWPNGVATDPASGKNFDPETGEVITGPEAGPENGPDDDGELDRRPDPEMIDVGF